MLMIDIIRHIVKENYLKHINKWDFNMKKEDVVVIAVYIGIICIVSMIYTMKEPNNTIRHHKHHLHDLHHLHD